MATIAIDYDGTYTVDPVLWEEFAKSARARGHNVICMTARYTPPNHDNLRMPTFPVVCTGGKQKRDYAELAELTIDIWIDDMPETITRASRGGILA